MIDAVVIAVIGCLFSSHVFISEDLDRIVYLESFAKRCHIQFFERIYVQFQQYITSDFLI